VIESSAILIFSIEKLYDLFLVWTPKYPTSISLKISAPNLQTFHLAGYALDHYCMRDSPDLLHATISLKLPAKSRGNQASIKDNFNKVLHSVQKARRLNLQDVFVEVRNGTIPSVCLICLTGLTDLFSYLVDYIFLYRLINGTTPHILLQICKASLLIRSLRILNTKNN
jgi:hypothetical protein